MGDVIAFKLVDDKKRLRPPLESTAKIVAFTGGWHAPMCKSGHLPTLKPVEGYERCRSKFSRSLGPLWPRVAAALFGARALSSAAVKAS